MEDRLKHNYTNDGRLIRLLKSSYNIDTLSILKESDASFIINTESQNLMLHKYSHKHGSCLRNIYIKAYLKEKGFPYTSDIVKSISGANYIKHGHNIYYIEKIIGGALESIDCMEDYKKACQVLGAFHFHAAGFTYKDYPLRDNIKRLNRKIHEKTAQAYSIKSIIERKSMHTYFDKSYMCIIDELINRLELCSKLCTAYDQLCQEARQEPYICHNSIVKDLIKTESGLFYINSFPSCSIDIPVYELSELIKNFISLESNNWDFNAIRGLIDAYNCSRPLSINEYKALLCLLIMPDKLLSIGKKRYIKKKSWSERKYSRRLERALLIFNKQQHLIQPFAETYGISL